MPSPGPNGDFTYSLLTSSKNVHTSIRHCFGSLLKEQLHHLDSSRYQLGTLTVYNSQVVTSRQERLFTATFFCFIFFYTPTMHPPNTHTHT